MQDLNDKVRVALEVYLARGREALAALQEQRSEDFFQIMSRRDAAFHNFRAIDALAGPSGVSIDGRLRQLWNEIDQVNRTLQGSMSEACSALEGRLGRLRAGRAQTLAYHSGASPPLRLVKQV